jgi:hypothetical protein
VRVCVNENVCVCARVCASVCVCLCVHVCVCVRERERERERVSERECSIPWDAAEWCTKTYKDIGYPDTHPLCLRFQCGSALSVLLHKNVQRYAFRCTPIFVILHAIYIYLWYCTLSTYILILHTIYIYLWYCTLWYCGCCTLWYCTLWYCNCCTLILWSQKVQIHNELLLQTLQVPYLQHYCYMRTCACSNTVTHAPVNLVSL